MFFLAVLELGCGPDENPDPNNCYEEPIFFGNKGNYTKECNQSRDDMIIYEVMDPADPSQVYATPLPVARCSLYRGAGFNMDTTNGLGLANAWGNKIVGKGYIGVAIDYARPTGEANKIHGANMTAAAVRWLKAHSYYYLDESDSQVKEAGDRTIATDDGKKYHIDPTKIAVVGISKGGFMALQLGIMNRAEYYSAYEERVQNASDSYVRIGGGPVPEKAGWQVKNDTANEVAKTFNSEILGAVAVSAGADMIAGYSYCAATSELVDYDGISMSSDYLSTLFGIASCVPIDPVTGLINSAEYNALLTARGFATNGVILGEFDIDFFEADEFGVISIHQPALSAFSAFSILDFAQGIGEGEYAPPMLILNGRFDATVRPEAGMLTGRYLKSRANDRTVITTVFEGGHQSSDPGSFEIEVAAATWKFLETLFNSSAETITASEFDATFRQLNGNQSARTFFCGGSAGDCDDEGTTLP